MRNFLRVRQSKRFLNQLAIMVDGASVAVLEEEELEPVVREVSLAAFADLHDYATWRLTGHHKACECWEE